MKLPSGIELSREKMKELCECIIREKFRLECKFAEAFNNIASILRDGEFYDIPILGSDDINSLYDAFRDVVIDYSLNFFH